MKALLARIVLFIFTIPVLASLVVACFGGIVTWYCARLIGMDEGDAGLYAIAGQISWVILIFVLSSVVAQ